MKEIARAKSNRLFRAGPGAIIAALLALVLVACGGPQATTPPVPQTSPAIPATTAAPGPATTAAPTTQAPASTAPATSTAAPPATTAPSLKALKIDPVQGFVGDKFTIVAEGLATGNSVDFQWMGWEAKYVNDVIPDNVQYVERTYSLKRASLGRAVADAQGRATLTIAAPEDHGEAHDIFAVVDGKDVAKGGYRLMRSVTISSTSGAVGAPITITVKGMATSYYQSTMAVLWDNRYTGFISTVTTKGTGVAKIRAAGPPGAHVIQVYSASQAMPYLNSQDNLRNWHIFSHLPDQFVYTVTADKGAPEFLTEWPEDSDIAPVTIDTPRTTMKGKTATPVVAAVVEPSRGPVFSSAMVQAKGLAPNTEVDLTFVTARGNRTSGSGWVLDVLPLGKAKTGADGSLQTSFKVPDDLGGWHSIRVMAGETLVAEAPYFVERSLVQVTPRKAKAGELITIQMKGVGWTELDNGVAVTYDNSYFGYACGFSSNGTINLLVRATGGPGTHLIDIYPMVYEGHPNKQVFNFQVPQLTALQDHPGLTLGYRAPIWRVAVEVVE